MRMLVSDMAGRASIELKARELGYDLAGQDELLTRVLGRGQGPRAARLHLRRGRRLVRAAAARRGRGRAARLLRGRVLAGHHRRPRRRRTALSEATVKLRRRRRAAWSPPARATARSTPSTTPCARRSPPAYPEIDKLELIDFRVRILDAAHGTDAVTRVLIETSDGATSWETVGVAANIVEASLAGPGRRHHLRPAAPGRPGPLRAGRPVMASDLSRGRPGGGRMAG